MRHLHIIGTKYTSVDGDNNEHEVEKKLASQISEPNKQNNVNKVEVEYYLKKKKTISFARGLDLPLHILFKDLATLR